MDTRPLDAVATLRCGVDCAKAAEQPAHACIKEFGGACSESKSLTCVEECALRRLYAVICSYSG